VTAQRILQSSPDPFLGHFRDDGRERTISVSTAT
jgi:hypothetical protein